MKAHRSDPRQFLIQLMHRRQTATLVLTFDNLLSPCAEGFQQLSTTSFRRYVDWLLLSAMICDLFSKFVKEGRYMATEFFTVDNSLSPCAEGFLLLSTTSFRTSVDWLLLSAMICDLCSKIGKGRSASLVR